MTLHNFLQGSPTLMEILNAVAYGFLGGLIVVVVFTIWLFNSNKIKKGK